MHWDGTRWLRYDGQQWVDATTGSPVSSSSPVAPTAPATTPAFAAPPAPSNSNMMMLSIIGGAVLVVLVLVLVVVLVSSSQPTATPSSSPGGSSSSPTATASPTKGPATPEQVAAVAAAIASVDTELTAYNKAVKKSGRTHDYAPAQAKLDAAQRNVATVHALAEAVQWPLVATDSEPTAAEIDAYEAAATQWIAVQREIALGLQSCFNTDGGMACVNRVAKRTEAREVASVAAYRSAWIALGGRAK